MTDQCVVGHQGKRLGVVTLDCNQDSFGGDRILRTATLYALSSGGKAGNLGVMTQLLKTWDATAEHQILRHIGKCVEKEGSGSTATASA